jgi:UDP:flavonoid glycosyltransferase YjiC (YdhE family)
LKITFLTFGTEGDSRPMAALAAAARAKGHHVQLLADNGAAGLAKAHNVPFIALAGDMRGTLLPGGALSSIMQEGGGVTRITKAFGEIAKANTGAWMEAATDAARGGDLLVFAGLAAFAGMAVADGLGQRCAGAGAFPLTPTREFATPFLRPKNRPGWVNLLSHKLFDTLAWGLFRGAVNEGRKRVFGQPPRRKMWRGYPMIYGFSPSLVPRPADWPPEVEICGAWHLPAKDWKPPRALERFLGAGEPPAYIGFGSMAGFDREKLLRAIVDAVGSRRAVIYPGWSGIDALPLPGNFHVLGDTPHDWLFPRVSLIVHHGGSGTTHSAARSGRPSVVVPFAGDQFFWADRVVKAGIGSACKAAASLDGAELRQRMSDATSAKVRHQAKAIGDAMRREDGKAHALDALEKIMLHPVN